LPNEAAVIAELRKSVPADGLYFFPSPDFSGKATPEELVAFEARFRAGPTGMLVYHAAGGSPVSPTKLILQFASELLASGIAAYVVALVAAPYWTRVLVVGSFGVFGCLSISALYWNWYGFPTSFFLAQCADKVLGWLLAGAAIAWIAPHARSPLDRGDPAERSR
jgi:hypothetical protein